ncbi:MAG: hypothetical protein KAW47_03170 [Thermoplasmatales archaeon]|nr:hypothetical protein [Thermoplasmatales archaeon]
MKTYVEILHSVDGEKVSVIFEKMKDMGLKPALGEHEFVYNWKKNVTLPEVIKFLDGVVSKLRGTKAILKFTTIR